MDGLQRFRNQYTLGCPKSVAKVATDQSMPDLQDTAVILGREQARLQEELEQVRRQVSQVAHVMQVSCCTPCSESPSES